MSQQSLTSEEGDDQPDRLTGGQRVDGKEMHAAHGKRRVASPELQIAQKQIKGLTDLLKKTETERDQAKQQFKQYLGRLVGKKKASDEKGAVNSASKPLPEPNSSKPRDAQCDCNKNPTKFQKLQEVQSKYDHIVQRLQEVEKAYADTLRKSPENHHKSKLLGALSSPNTFAENLEVFLDAFLGHGDDKSVVSIAVHSVNAQVIEVTQPPRTCEKADQQKPKPSEQETELRSKVEVLEQQKRHIQKAYKDQEDEVVDLRKKILALQSDLESLKGTQLNLHKECQENLSAREAQLKEMFTQEKESMEREHKSYAESWRLSLQNNDELRAAEKKINARSIADIQADHEKTIQLWEANQNKWAEEEKDWKHRLEAREKVARKEIADIQQTMKDIVTQKDKEIQAISVKMGKSVENSEIERHQAKVRSKNREQELLSRYEAKVESLTREKQHWQTLYEDVEKNAKTSKEEVERSLNIQNNKAQETLTKQIETIKAQFQDAKNAWKESILQKEKEHRRDAEVWRKQKEEDAMNQSRVHEEVLAKNETKWAQQFHSLEQLWETKYAEREQEFSVIQQEKATSHIRHIEAMEQQQATSQDSKERTLRKEFSNESAAMVARHKDEILNWEKQLQANKLHSRAMVESLRNELQILKEEQQNKSQEPNNAQDEMLEDQQIKYMAELDHHKQMIGTLKQDMEDILAEKFELENRIGEMEDTHHAKLESLSAYENQRYRELESLYKAQERRQSTESFKPMSPSAENSGDGFQATLDPEFRKQFEELSKQIFTLSRCQLSVSVEALGHIFQEPEFVQKVKLERLSRLVIERALWTTVHAGFFSSPFKVFGLYGENLLVKWCELFVKGMRIHLSNG